MNTGINSSFFLQTKTEKKVTEPPTSYKVSIQNSKDKIINSIGMKRR